jgi:two-component sensor histidine kinase
MESEREESVENTLRIMAVILRQQEKTIQVDFTPEFLEEVADEISALKQRLAEQS